MKGPQLGDAFPFFELRDHENRTRTLTEFNGPLVVYFYPADETPGCTKEACSFRDNYESFTEAGATVIGISDDSWEKHAKFKKNRGLPFTLLSDPKGKFRKQIGVPTTFGILPGRVTYVLDENGIITKVFNSQLAATKHVPEALAAIQALKPSP